MKVVRYASLVVLELGLSSCKPVHCVGDCSVTSAIVSSSDKQAAFDIVASTRDYLPFDYKVTGCADRSRYVSMELAAAGIPSSSLFVFGNLKFDSAPEAGWSYHTAPILTDSDNPTIDNAFVLDPSLFEKPVPIRTWAKRAQEFDNTPDERKHFQLLVVEPGEGVPSNLDWNELFAALPIVNTIDKLQDVFSGYKLIHSLAEVEVFDQSDIEFSCNTLYGHLGLLENAEPRRKLLLKRTEELVTSLKKRNKYNERRAKFNCPEPGFSVTFPTNSSEEPGPVVDAVKFCKFPEASGYRWLNQAFFGAKESDCSEVMAYVRTANTLGEGLRDSRQRALSQCVHSRLKCESKFDFEEFVDNVIKGSDYRDSSCKMISGEMRPRSCEDLSLLMQYSGLDPDLNRNDFSCWQKLFRCADRLRQLVPGAHWSAGGVLPAKSSGCNYDDADKNRGCGYNSAKAQSCAPR